MPSLIPIANSRLLGENASEFTGFICGSVNSNRLVTGFQSLTVLSLPPVANHLPSRENDTEVTQFLCLSPSKAPSSLPVAVSHSFVVWSELVVASHFPSVENASEVICPVCSPESVPGSSVRLHNLTERSLLDVTNCLPA